ncbi:hypothetical protein [Labilibacter marinus]|uniref:hypothetical protein n=1 Tax=Labilibacter marinus TaxID=1477105 RepID=UPI00094FDFB6|nr:hypothetical protein [Labilibacter marinus]
MKKIFDFKTLIALSGIILPIVIFILSKNVKEISFKNVAMTELVSEQNISDESIQVFFDKQQVFNLYSISCLISNSGNIPITQSEYIDGLKIEFPDSVTILKYSIKSIPNNISITRVLESPNILQIQPDLLNPNDNIEISFYVSSSQNILLPSINSRIVGGHIKSLEMNEVVKPKTEFQNNAFASFEGVIYWMSLIYTGFYILLIFWAIYFQKNVDLDSAIGKFFLFLFLAIGLFSNLFYLIQTH